MYRKYLSILLVIAMIFGVTSCKKDISDTSSSVEQPIVITSKIIETTTTETTESIPEYVYSLDSLTEAEIVKLAVFYATLKEQEDVKSIYDRLKVVPYGDEDGYKIYRTFPTFEYERNVNYDNLNRIQYKYIEEEDSDEYHSIRLYPNSMVEFSFWFKDEDRAIKVANAFYEYLTSLDGELEEAIQNDPNRLSNYLVSTIVYKQVEITDTNILCDPTVACKYDGDTYYYSPNFAILLKTDGIYGNFLTVEIPVNGVILKE